MNTAPEARPAQRLVSLYEVVAQLERHFGPRLVHDRLRWRTADGMIEYRHAHLYADQMRRQKAGERLEIARAVVMANGSETATKLARDDEGAMHGDS